jgi:hypothetical protein
LKLENSRHDSAQNDFGRISPHDNQYVIHGSVLRKDGRILEKEKIPDNKEESDRDKIFPLLTDCNVHDKYNFSK